MVLTITRSLAHKHQYPTTSAHQMKHRLPPSHPQTPVFKVTRCGPFSPRSRRRRRRRRSPGHSGCHGNRGLCFWNPSGEEELRSWPQFPGLLSQSPSGATNSLANKEQGDRATTDSGKENEEGEEGGDRKGDGKRARKTQREKGWKWGKEREEGREIVEGPGLSRWSHHADWC